MATAPTDLSSLQSVAATRSAAPTNKAVAATGGSAFGAAVSVLAIWLLRDEAGVAIPEQVQAAITTIITAILTLAAAYYTPPGSGEAVVMTPQGPKTARISGVASIPS